MKRAEKEALYRERVKRRILTNTTSAVDYHRDLKAAEEAGAHGAQDLASSVVGHNSKRDLLNKVLRDNEWPGLYWAQIPLRDPKTSARKLVWVPFLLPHEWVA